MQSFLKIFLILISILNINSIQAKELNVSSGEQITAQQINDINKPDYDSGWIVANALTNNIISLDHNLGVIPSRVTVMTAVSIPEGIAGQRDMVRIVNPDSMGLKYTSPEATNFTLNKVFLVFYATDEFFYCDTNAQCHKQDGTLYGTGTFQTGEIRIKLWK